VITDGKGYRQRSQALGIQETMLLGVDLNETTVTLPSLLIKLYSQRLKPLLLPERQPLLSDSN